MRTGRENLRTQALISKSKYKASTKNNLERIYIAFRHDTFAPKDIIELIHVAPNTATSYISKLSELNVLTKTTCVGQSKYRFKDESH